MHTRRDYAFAVEVSENAKTGPVSATYAARESCPKDCPLSGEGCYADGGPIRIQTPKPEDEPSPEEIAQAEADAIDMLSARNDLRLHVVGDCTTRKAAQILAAAAKRYIKRSMQYRPFIGKDVWTYTHSWRKIPRKDWGLISVLASCETMGHVEQATRIGYAAALIVPSFEDMDTSKLIACPNQTMNKKCIDCRLCMDDEKLLRMGKSIAFEPHGARKRVLKELIQLGIRSKA